MPKSTMVNDQNQASNAEISDQEKINWIRLVRSQNISRQNCFELIDFFGSARSALENVVEFYSKKKFQKPIAVCSQQQAEYEFEQTSKFGAKIIIFTDKQYPKLLKEIADPPPLITTKGDISLLNKRVLAIVGPRDCSYNGAKFAKMIASQLGNKNFVISSGLAKGIDAAAHLGSIVTGTIAVIAGGIDNVYPIENKNLYQQIANQGLIISEIAFGMKPRSGNFPQRNRIISGLSLGVIVVEATIRSGTLITARLALEQNREVFAVPGSPFDPRCQGTNNLIKQGAKLIENVDDILAELSLESGLNQEDIEPKQRIVSSLPPKSEEGFVYDAEAAEAAKYLVKENINKEKEDSNLVKKLIISKIGYEPISIDEIVNLLELPAQVINVALVQLELTDQIQRKNGKICLIPN